MTRPEIIAKLRDIKTFVGPGEDRQALGEILYALGQEQLELKRVRDRKSNALRMLEARMFGEQYADGAAACDFYRELRAVLTSELDELADALTKLIGS